MTPLSILDLSPVPAGGTPGDALRNSIDLAQVADRAGYRRYWVGEHHLNPGVASSSTPVLVALLAAATSTIRVGSGAVQLPNTPPLQVAEQFGTVAAVHPARVDLGLGRFDLHKILALIQDGQAAARGEAPPPPPPRVVDGLLIPSPGRVARGDLSTFAALGALPHRAAHGPRRGGRLPRRVPAVGAPGPPARHGLRRRRGGRDRLPGPGAGRAVRAVGARHPLRARRAPLRHPEQARARVWTDEERAGVQDRISTQVVGSPRTAAEALATLARATRADELLVTTITTEHVDRVRSTELLAEAWAVVEVAA